MTKLGNYVNGGGGQNDLLNSISKGNIQLTYALHAQIKCMWGVGFLCVNL